jgi:ubiquinone/menaquinone biosynthesis C-methylase UbiE
MTEVGKAVAQKVARAFGCEITAANDSLRAFHSDHYLRHNARRLEHLASLRIPVSGMTVLEVGAGIGDHSTYYLDRGCTMLMTEERSENLEILRRRFPDQNIRCLNMEKPEPLSEAPFDVVHCYGLLYHLQNPENALRFLSSVCRGKLFLETCVSFGDDEAINPVSELQINPTQASSGIGCRPTRPWLFKTLRQLFEHVYVPQTQPNHEEFPLDWTTRDHPPDRLSRAMFIASREEIKNEILRPSLISRHERHP